MSKNLNNTHASKRSANLGPGLTFESVGVFFMEKINIYKPKPLPREIAEQCIQSLSHRLGQLEIDQCHDKLLWPTYLNEKSKIKLYLIYYRECIRLYEKGQPNE
jgi:hypothetical protein